MGGFIVGNICLSYNPDSVHPSIRYIPLLILYPLIIKYTHSQSIHLNTSTNIVDNIYKG